MTDQGTEGSSDRRMNLRYAGNCRVCGTGIAAGSSAFYERARRTVRCLDCTDAAAPAGEGKGVSPSLSGSSSADDLRFRAPASAVICEVLRAQSGAPPRSRWARLFGRSPLSATSDPWYLGAVGELEIGRLLDRLGPEWTAIHAIPIGKAGSDIDHLVIGPGGIFTINAKHHEGKRIWLGARRLLVNGQRTDHLRNAAFEGRRVAKLLSRGARRPIAVTPIVAIVGARGLTVRERPADVEVIVDRQLVGWLQRRGRAILASEVDELTRIALDPETWGNPTLVAPDLNAFAALRETVAAARRRRRAWALAALLIPFAVLATAVAVLQAALLAVAV